MRRALTVVALVGLTALVASPAVAQSQGIIDQAVAGLRSNPVYVDPGAERASDVDVDGIRRRISRTGTRIFIAVLPAVAADEAGGDPARVATALGQGLRQNGTYAAVTGDTLSAASSTLAAGQANQLAAESRRAHSADDVDALLADFVDRVAEETGAATGGGDSGAPESSGDEGGGGGGTSVLLLLLLLGGGGGLLFLWSRNRRQQRAAEEAEEAENRELLEAEISVLADDVMSLEPQIAIHPEAADDYEAAVSRFRVAQTALAHADDPIDLIRVRRVVDEARYAMSRARARVQGREPPLPPPDLAQPGRRGEPALDLDDDGRPAYVGYGGPFYGGGWFGGGGGLLSGLFLGSMLGGGFGGWGGGYHETNVYVEDQDGGDGGDGGGDFGGGDFGGGDFGGGDFGGGDFGGGDF